MAHIALVDDHKLLRKGLKNLLEEFNHTILFEGNNGQELIDFLQTDPELEIVLLDISMPVLDGYETALWLKRNEPDIKVLVLSMYDDETAILRMLKNGARGYILKDCDPSELKTAIYSLLTKGYYHSELVSSRLIRSINRQDDSDDDNPNSALHLSERELTFLKWACSEYTYKEIAAKMNVSVRTIDGYRDDLFEKLNIKSRVGLAIYAIKYGIVRV